MARAECGLAQAGVMWWTITANLMIWGVYTAISLLMLYALRSRHDVAGKMRWCGYGFAVFIAFCGQTHLINVDLYFCPIYRFDALLNQLTAWISLATLLYMIRYGPYLLTFRTPGDLRAMEISVQEERHLLELLGEINQRLDHLNHR